MQRLDNYSFDKLCEFDLFAPFKEHPEKLEKLLIFGSIKSFNANEALEQGFISFILQGKVEVKWEDIHGYYCTDGMIFGEEWLIHPGNWKYEAIEPVKIFIINPSLVEEGEDQEVAYLFGSGKTISIAKKYETVLKRYADLKKTIREIL